MIATYRPDLSAASTLEALSSPAEAPFACWRPGGRRQHMLSRGREAVTWCLSTMGGFPGCEVLLPALMGDSVPGAVLGAGYRPVTFGVDPDTLQPSPQLCEAAITPACRAVVVPHLFGRSADIQAFRGLADSRGLLLVEDCAHRLDDRPGPQGEGATGDICLYSYDYGKPVAGGWGGALTLRAGDEDSASGPVVPPMDESDDLLLAAAFVLYVLLTSPDRMRRPRLSETYALGRLSSTADFGPAGRPGIWVEEVLERAMAGDVEGLERWCDDHGLDPGPSRAWWLSPRAKSFIRRVLPQRVQVRAGMTGPTAGEERLAGRSLKAGGLTERLMSRQYTDVVGGAWAARRLRIARIYQEGLDPRKFSVPVPDVEARWLMYPTLVREPSDRDRLVRAAVRRMEVDVSVWTWPVPVHRLPVYDKLVRTGPGSEETHLLMKRLLNLPVHAGVTPRAAHGLVDALNRA